MPLSNVRGTILIEDNHFPGHMNRSFYSGLAVAAFTICAATPAAVFALGSGGGGSTPTPACTADVWQCGNFAECSAAGYKYRTCSKTFDCPNYDTPKPSETQTCTPPAAPAPAPTTTTAPATNCTADTFKCTDFAACDKDGVEHRTCQKTVDCASAATPEPALVQPCSKLQCGDLATTKERVTCRLGLSAAGLKRELEIKYLPEECQAIVAGANRDACIARYQSFKPCWQIAAGAGRFACAAQVLQLPTSLKAEADRCKTFDGSERSKCESTLRDKGFAMIKFRMYDLEKRAEVFLANDRITIDQAATFIAGVYQQKAAFNTATTFEGRKAALVATQELWKLLIANLKR